MFRYLRRWPSTLPLKRSRRMFLPLSASLRIASGWRPSWNWLVIVTKLYGRANYEVIKTEWELTLREDHHSFEVNKMTDRPKQLLRIKEAMHSKIHPHESEAGAWGRKKTLVQPLKQYHAFFYQLYEKGVIHAMVGLQGLHSGDAFRHPNVSLSVGLKSFYPWFSS